MISVSMAVGPLNSLFLMALLTFYRHCRPFFDTIIVTYFHPSVYPLFPSVISSFSCVHRQFHIWALQALLPQTPLFSTAFCAIPQPIKRTSASPVSPVSPVPLPKTSLFEGGGPPAGGGRSFSPVGSNPFSSYFSCITKETLISQSLFLGAEGGI